MNLFFELFLLPFALLELLLNTLMGRRAEPVGVPQQRLQARCEGCGAKHLRHGSELCGVCEGLSCQHCGMAKDRGEPTCGSELCLRAYGRAAATLPFKHRRV